MPRRCSSIGVQGSKFFFLRRFSSFLDILVHGAVATFSRIMIGGRCLSAYARMAKNVSPDSPRCSSLSRLKLNWEKSTQEKPATSIWTRSGTQALPPYAVVLHDVRMRDLKVSEGDTHPENGFDGSSLDLQSSTISRKMMGGLKLV